MGQTTAAGAFGKFNNPHITLNSVDLTDEVRDVTITRSAQAEEEISASGDTLHAKFTQGRYATEIQVNFWQDFYTGGVHETIEGVIDGEANVSLVFKPEDTTTSTTNKEYTYTVLPPSNYGQVEGSFDSNLSTSVTFRVTGAPVIATS